MTHKHIFLGCAAIGLLGLCFICLVLSALAVAGFLQLDIAVASINLLVDVIVGVFTVWGLFWAASEFSEQSLRPEIGLILGEEEDVDGQVGYNPVYGTQISACGRCNQQDQAIVGIVEIGLFLENRHPRMAQRIQLAIEIESNPQTSSVSPKPDSFGYDYHPNITPSKAVLRFEDDLVVYEGEGVFLGVLQVKWQQAPLPNACELKYAIYKAEGRPDIGRHSIRIDWE